MTFLDFNTLHITLHDAPKRNLRIARSKRQKELTRTEGRAWAIACGALECPMLLGNDRRAPDAVEVVARGCQELSSVAVGADHAKSPSHAG